MWGCPGYYVGGALADVGAPWLVWGHPSWYVGLPWMDCGGHLTGRGTLAGMCSSLTHVGVPWLLCEVKLTGVGGTLVGVGGTLLGVRVPWLAQGHPGWCVQFPGFCGGGVPWLLRQGDTLSGMWGAPWLACWCLPSTRGDKMGQERSSILTQEGAFLWGGVDAGKDYT